MELLVETMPSDQIEELLLRAGETRDLDELADAASWNSYAQFRRLLEERFRLDPTSLYQQAGLLSDWLRTEELTQAAQTVGTPGELLAGGRNSNPLVPIKRYEAAEVAPNEWTIREWFEDGYEPFPEFCDFAAFQYAIVPILCNLPSGEVVEEECQGRGDASCLFRLRWQNPETDGQKAEHYRVHAELLETRLEQIQDMITDLASNEHYEDVLQGFVASSLEAALGCGGALLALEPRAGAPRKVYSEGLAESEAEAIADDLLAGGSGPGQSVAVEVASARRRYGVLAVDEGGGVFSALSQSTLKTYARLAAAALDTADALDEARHLAKTAQVLLDLATSLTEIVSTQEMASKVAQAVPDVIDCDRAIIFLDTVGEYGTCTDGLRLAGSIGYSDEEVASDQLSIISIDAGRFGLRQRTRPDQSFGLRERRVGIRSDRGSR